MMRHHVIHESLDSKVHDELHEFPWYSGLLQWERTQLLLKLKTWFHELNNKKIRCNIIRLFLLMEGLQDMLLCFEYHIKVLFLVSKTDQIYRMISRVLQAFLATPGDLKSSVFPNLFLIWYLWRARTFTYWLSAYSLNKLTRGNLRIKSFLL